MSTSELTDEASTILELPIHDSTTANRVQQGGTERSRRPERLATLQGNLTDTTRTPEYREHPRQSHLEVAERGNPDGVPRAG
jgi:hypothetical protein